MTSGIIASRTASILIAISLLLTPFTGVLLFAGTTEGQGSLPSDYSNGDRIIGRDYSVHQWNVTSQYTMTGNLTIRAGGIVTVDGGSLVFAQNLGGDGIPYTADDRVYTLIIEDGGKLILKNATVTTNVNQLNAFPSLGVIVRNGGTIEAYDSTLAFPGHMIVDDSTLTMWRSSITGLKTVGTYCDPDIFPTEVFGFAPVLLFMSSTVNLYDSSLPNIYEDPDPDTMPAGLYDSIYNHAYPFVSDMNGPGGARLGADYTLLRTPAAIGSTDTTGQALVNITFDDLMFYQVGAGETLSIEGFDIAGLVFNAGEVDIVLNVEYYTDEGYSSSSPLLCQYRNGQLWSSSIVFQETPINPVTGSADQITEFNALPDMSSLDLAQMNVTFTNNGGQTIYINKIWAEVSMNLPTYRTVTLAGNTSFTAVNSFISVDFSDLYYHNEVVLRDCSVAYLYGASINTTKDASSLSKRVPAFVTVEKTVDVTPIQKSINDGTGQAVGSITALDGIYYEIDGSQVMDINSFNTTGLSGAISAATLWIWYHTDDPYAQSNYVQIMDNNGQFVNTNMTIGQSTIEASDYFNAYRWGVSNISDITDMEIRFINGDATNSAYINKMSVMVTLSPTVYIYRWANLTVYDNQDLPVNGAVVTMVVEDESGDSAYYYTPEGVRNYPSDEVLTYLRTDVAHWSLTNEVGKVNVPLLSEVIDTANPNPVSALSYVLTVTYIVSPEETYTNETGISFNPYPDMSRENTWKDITMLLSDLALDLPDLIVQAINLTPAVLYEGETVTIATTIRNRGLTTATNVEVRIVCYVNGVTPVFWSNQTIDTIAPSETIGVDLQAIDWTNLPAGIHTVSVSIDPLKQVVEQFKNNNLMSKQFTVLANWAELSITSSDIVFNPQPATTSDLVTATIYVNNTGRAAAENATVLLYAGSITSGGKFIGSTVITVATGSISHVTYSWNPTQIGTYPIYVYLNNERTIKEYDYTNNTAYKSITVSLDIDENTDLVVGGEKYPTLTIYGPYAFPWATNVAVIGDGVLTLNNTQFTMRMDIANELTIVVRDNGQLVLVNGAVLNANHNVNIYLEDNANLTVIGSTIQYWYNIEADDASEIYIASSTINADLYAPNTSSALVVAQDTNFGRAWSSFGGHAVAHVTNVSIDALNAKESATIYHYRWVYVSIFDGTFELLPGAYVEVKHPVNGVYASGITGTTGTLKFRVLSDVRVANMSVNEGFVGSYFVNTTYTYGGQTFEGQSVMNIAMTGYSVPLVRVTIPTVSIVVPDALPDLDPPLIVSDDQPARNQEVTVTTEVSNNGVVPAHNVLVMFNDTGVIFHQYTIPVILPGETITVSTKWIASYPLGVHNLTVAIDPYHRISEMNERDNTNYTLVTVVGIADLSISRSDVTITPTPTRDQDSTITATVHNDGDLGATNVLVDFRVSYEGSTYVSLGTMPINNIIKNGTASVSITWTPNVAGDYKVWVIIVEPGGVEGENTTNNDVEFDQKVLDFADLIVQTITFNPASQAKVKQDVTITATVVNIGEIAATNVVVNFYLGSHTGLYIGTGTIASINAGASQTVTAHWTANVTHGLRTEVRTLSAWVNPENEVNEIHYDNNWMSQTITVKDDRSDIYFPYPGEITVRNAGASVNNSGEGETVTISAIAGNSGETAAAGVEFVFYVLDEEHNQVIIGTVTKDLGVQKTVPISIDWTINVTMGNYTLVINANPNHEVDESNTTNDQVQRDFIIDAPDTVLVINPVGTQSYAPGTSIYVTGMLTNEHTNKPIAGAVVHIYLAQSGVMKGTIVNATTGSTGVFGIDLYVPEGLSGDCEIHGSATIGDKVSTNLKYVTIKATGETGVPWYLYLVILALVAVVIIGFSAYLFKYGLGKMVECGECGSLIPESSKRCPKCGVEFEVGTAKCSECGAWIPSNSTSCPECGAKFITEAQEEEENAYLKKMREQYDAFVDTYREEARRTLGKKYSDAKFPDWWKKQPSYVSFESWMSQEEEKRKSGGIACQVCGTLNPRGSTLCHKCGSTIELPKVEAPIEEPKAEGQPSKPLRRIVRRPVEKKQGAKTEAPIEEPKTEEAKPEENKPQE